MRRPSAALSPITDSRHIAQYAYPFILAYALRQSDSRFPYGVHVTELSIVIN